MMQRKNLNQRIAILAACLDSVAFKHRLDFALAKRRDAAWREAANRIGQQVE
jgi:hypothetical protein